MMRRQWRRREARERRPMARQRGFRSAPRLFAKESCGAGTVSLKEMRRNEGNDLLYLQYCVPCQDIGLC